MNLPLNRNTLAFAGFLAIGGYFLWTEHSAHLTAALPYLPYLLLLACALLHVFMHRGHGGHGHVDPDPKGGLAKKHDPSPTAGERPSHAQNDGERHG